MRPQGAKYCKLAGCTRLIPRRRPNERVASYRKKQFCSQAHQRQEAILRAQASIQAVLFSRAPVHVCSEPGCGQLVQPKPNERFSDWRKRLVCSPECGERRNQRMQSQFSRMSSRNEGRYAPRELDPEHVDPRPWFVQFPGARYHCYRDVPARCPECNAAAWHATLEGVKCIMCARVFPVAHALAVRLHIRFDAEELHRQGTDNAQDRMADRSGGVR